MKRINGLFDQVCNMDNLLLAEKLAGRGKSDKRAVLRYRRNTESNLLVLQNELLTGTYQTSEYTIFPIFEGKERIIYSLPYRDRIVQHAIMNILEPYFMKWFTADTYASIKGRGIHSAAEKIKRALRDRVGTRYCLKIDIKKFYPSVDNEILKSMLSRKIKDQRLLQLLFEIIDSATGLPIGNYLSQFLSNFFMTGFDHWIKEVMKVEYYFRYADDIVIFHRSKRFLHHLLFHIRQYLGKLKLQVKENYQVFPVDSRGVDYLGYKFYHRFTLIRKSIKRRYARMMIRSPNPESIAAYNGWLMHCDSKHLQKQLTLKTA